MLRLAYTLTNVWDTIPVLLAYLGDVYPQLTVDAREVFGGDIPELLQHERYDLAIAPMTSYPRGFRQRTVRRERLRLALGDGHPLAGASSIELSELRDQRFEIWPREMAPGFYDAVVGACRAAGFEPDLDERAAGNTVWGYIARRRGVGLINASLAEQLPRGITLVDVIAPQATLTVDAVWNANHLPIVGRTLDAAAALASARDWL